MPNNLLHETDLGEGLRRYAYDQMLNAFYPYVSRDGAIDLASATPEVDVAYEHLLGMGFAEPVLQLLTKKAVLDIPEIKDEIMHISPEDFGENSGAEA